MKHIIKQGQSFEKSELELIDAFNQIEKWRALQKEYAQELAEKHNLKSLTFYKNGHFLDMYEGSSCREHEEIPQNCFKLKSVAGAYWRGDSNNTMMTRIYAWAFESGKNLSTP